MRKIMKKTTREELYNSLLKYYSKEEAESIDASFDFWNIYYAYNKLYIATNMFEYREAEKEIRKSGLFMANEFPPETKLFKKLNSLAEREVERILLDKKNQILSKRV